MIPADKKISTPIRPTPPNVKCKDPKSVLTLEDKTLIGISFECGSKKQVEQSLSHQCALQQLDPSMASLPQTPPHACEYQRKGR